MSERGAPTMMAIVVGVAAAGLVILSPGRDADKLRVVSEDVEVEDVDVKLPTVMSTGELPRRAGPKPRTTPTNPHTQLDQNAPPAMQAAIAAYMFERPCVEERPSIISVPGARAMWIHESCAVGDRTAFLMGREHAHLHPPEDGSLHVALPPALAEEAIAKGWAELHPVARRGLIPPTIVMLFGPRDDAELEVVKQLVDASFRFAHGLDGPAAR